MKKYTEEYKDKVFEKAFDIVKECVNELPKFKDDLFYHGKLIKSRYKAHRSLFPMCPPPNTADEFMLMISLDNFSIRDKPHGSFIKRECFIDGRVGNERGGKEVVDVIVPIDVEDVRDGNKEKVTVVFS